MADKYFLMIYNCIISTAIGACGGMELSAVISKSWFHSDKITCGLFTCCSIGNCWSVGGGGWQLWVKALLVISVTLMIISTVFVWFHGLSWQRSLTIGYISLGALYIAAAAATSGLIIYLVETKHKEDIIYSYGFIVFCICAFVSWIICIIQSVMLQHMRKVTKSYELCD